MIFSKLQYNQLKINHMENLDKQLLDGADSGILQIVETCLKLGTDVNTKGDYGDTALNKAASNGHTEVARRRRSRLSQ